MGYLFEGMALVVVLYYGGFDIFVEVQAFLSICDSAYF
jgi:hypothetical protein